MNTPDPTAAAPTIELVLITGMSGSGKSVALTALEDLGYYCVDNLPPELLLPFVQIEHSHGARKVAIAIDVRSAASLPGLPERLNQLRSQPEHGVHLRTVFLDSTTDTLVRRFSETRRRHPLSLRPREDDRHNALIDAIEQERELLSELRDQALVFDTSIMLPSELRTSIKSFVGVSHPGLTLVFESFAFKRGVPVDADFVFDVRMLPNPHYDPQLRPQTGRDRDVIAYLDAQADVQRMAAQIDGFLRHWLPAMQSDHRSYVTVAVGCTGGQHRSVYLAERLGAAFGAEWATRVRHREAGHWPAAARTAGRPSS